MKTSPSSLRFPRLCATLSVAMGLLVSGAFASTGDRVKDRANSTPHDPVSVSAREDDRLRLTDHESRLLVLSQARLASDLRGGDIYNAHGEKIGSIRDVVVDLNSGRAPYVVVQSGGVLGMGSRDRAVPLGALKPRLADGKRDGYSLDVSKELWEQAPVLERDRLTDLEDDLAGRNLHHVYGQVWAADVPVSDTANPTSPGVNPPDRGRKETGDAHTTKKLPGDGDKLARGQQLVLASELTGKALVIRAADREAGSIDDIVLAGEGTRAAILLDPAAALTKDGRKYVVSFDRVIREGSGRYVTDLKPEEFEATVELDGDKTGVIPGAVRLWPAPNDRSRVDVGSDSGM